MGTSRAGRQPGAAASADRPRGKETPPLPDIVIAALALIDAHGLDKFSLNALAAELGMFQPNMYRRVTSRHQLLDLVVDQIMTEVGTPAVDPSDWHGWLLEWGARVRSAWQRHPRAGALIHHGGEVSRTVMEQVLGVLLRSFPADLVVVVGKAYLSHVLGATLLEVRALSPGEPADAQALELLAPTYPNVLEFTRLEGARTTSPDAAERDFLQGLRILLDGFRPYSVSATTA